MDFTLFKVWGTGLPTPLAIAAAALAAVAVPLLMGLFKPKRKLEGKHVVITGGSKGIGLALALEFVRRGSHVTVLARSRGDLEQARQQLEALAQSCGRQACRVQALAADTTNTDQVKAALEEASRVAGPIDTLVCNAGLAMPGLFVEQPMSVFEQQMRVNYLGTVGTLKCALPGMLERGQGHIVLVASGLAVLGFAGYSCYAPTKWAVRGLADCLRNELQGTGVRVSIGYPPDTDTPGFALEDPLKPDICQAVNKALGSTLYPPEQVARAFIRSIERGAYHLGSPDLGLILLVDSMASVSPKLLPTPLGCLVAPISYAVTALLRRFADAAAKRCNRRGSRASGGRGKS